MFGIALMHYPCRQRRAMNLLSPSVRSFYFCRRMESFIAADTRPYASARHPCLQYWLSELHGQTHRLSVSSSALVSRIAPPAHLTSASMMCSFVIMLYFLRQLTLMYLSPSRSTCLPNIYFLQSLLHLYYPLNHVHSIQAPRPRRQRRLDRLGSQRTSPPRIQRPPC